MDILRDHYSRKKEQWAKTGTCYTGLAEWGQLYGYTLLPPFAESEVAQFESEHGFCLPPFFRDYLTCVSRETLVWHHAFPIVLHLRGACCIPDGETYVHDDGPDDEDCTLTDGMMRIGDEGCESETYLVVKGNRVGSLWSLGSGGDSLHLNTGSTFERYVGLHVPGYTLSERRT